MRVLRDESDRHLPHWPLINAAVITRGRARRGLTAAADSGTVHGFSGGDLIRRPVNAALANCLSHQRNFSGYWPLALCVYVPRAGERLETDEHVQPVNLLL
jgi:hypothetical protein